MPPLSRRHPAALLLERLVQIHPRCLPSRNESENEARDQRHQQRKPQHASIEVDILQTRQVARLYAQQKLQAPRAEDHAAEAADESEQQAFGQQLPDQAPARGTEGRADRELLLPRCRPRQQQIGDVRADDQQHETDRPNQQNQGRTCVSHDGRQHWPNTHGPSQFVVRILPFEVLGNDIHGRARLLDRHT